MAGFNPFAPQMGQKPVGAPQLPGIQAPQLPAEQPGLMETLAPKVAGKALDSETAGDIKDWGFGKAKEAWSAFNPVSPEVIPVSELSNASVAQSAATPMNVFSGGAEAAIAAQQAAAAGTAEAALMGATPAGLLGGAEAAIAAQTAAQAAASSAALTGAATAGTAAASTAASVAPAALAAGPFAPLVLMGAGLLAANSGK